MNTGTAVIVAIGIAAVSAFALSRPIAQDQIKDRKGTVDASVVDLNQSSPKRDDKVVKTDAEWQKILTPEQYRVLRQKGTERPYTGKLLHHSGDGFYACAGCGQKLYDSKTKYDSCGWPSFWDAIPGAVDKHPDLEATCSKCGGHLGHIFDDGPPPTGKRH